MALEQQIQKDIMATMKAKDTVRLNAVRSIKSAILLAKTAEGAVLAEYLPKQLSPEEVEAKLKEIIAEVGAAAPSDMGKVMGVATKRLAGLADGKTISGIVKQLLAK